MQEQKQMLFTPWEEGDTRGLPPTELVGGKGWGLYWLAANGFPTPPTWTVTTAVFDLFLQRFDLDRQFRQIGKAMESLERGKQLPTWQALDELEPVLRRLREQWLDFPLPDQVARHLEKLFIMPTAWAVRSSATVEDSPYKSFAGQFISFLSVPGGLTLWKTVLQVMVSVFGRPAIAYCIRNKTPVPKMAVLLQPMEPITERDRSGVAFSRSPLSGVEGIFIQATFGAGETVVGGYGGDLYTVRGDNVTVQQTPIETIRITGPAEGLVAVPPPTGSPLTLDEARQLAALVQQIEEKWGRPINIEFVWRADAPLQVVQVRSVTV